MREDPSHDPFWLEDLARPGCARMGLRESFLETLAEECVGLELAPVGSRLVRGDAFGFLHTGSRTHDLRAPFDLEILALNPAALADPGIVRLSPYGRGWLAEVRIGKL